MILPINTLNLLKWIFYLYIYIFRGGFGKKQDLKLLNLTPLQVNFQEIKTEAKFWRADELTVTLNIGVF